MAIYIGDKEVNDCNLGSKGVKEVYCGDIKIWPTVEPEDYIAFRYYRYGDGSQTPPYEIAPLMAHNWTENGNWYQNLVVFQFTDAFWKKNPDVIIGNNGYYVDNPDRVVSGAISTLNNPNEYSMFEIYEKYDYNTILNNLGQGVSIPPGQYFNINVGTGIFTKGKIHVIVIPPLQEGTYGSSGISHWNQERFPCVYTRKGSTKEYKLLPKMGWLSSSPSQISIIGDPRLAIPDSTIIDINATRVSLSLSTSDATSINLLENVALSKIMGQQIDIPINPGTKIVKIHGAISLSPVNPTVEHVAMFSVSPFDINLCKVKKSVISSILTGQTTVPDKFDWFGYVNKTLPIYFCMSRIDNVTVGIPITETSVTPPLIDSTV